VYFSVLLSLSAPCPLQTLRLTQATTHLSVSMEFITVVVFSFNMLMFANAKEFLTSSPRDLAEHISEDNVRATLLSEIDNSLPRTHGSRLASTRFSQIQKGLGPIYAALQKNEHGKVEHVVARYALHRFFVKHHGWVVKGLEPAGNGYNASSPAGLLKDQVPSYILDLFEQRVGGKGFNLVELAILAATVMHLIQDETVQQLTAAFAMHDVEQTGKLNRFEADQMLDSYIMSYIVSEDLNKMTLEGARLQISEMPDMFAHWGEAQEFVRAVKQRELSMAGDDVDQLGFESLVKVADAAGEQFGEFLHSKVCKGLKTRLMEMEHHGTGRVKLSSFYKPAINGYWQFGESVGYLRELGVLEETDPSQPSVMIANYVNSHANCIASSKLYSVCCRNECDGLLGHLEQQIAAPEAAPGTIVALIENLPSDTVSAPRALSATLLRRLEEMAAANGGMVALHGRLFAQWMHHAYPRECPFPHVSGTTSPKLPDEWVEASGIDVSASEEEMQQYIQWSRNSSASNVADEEAMTWSPEEELLVIRPVAGSQQSLSNKAPATTRSIVLFAVAGILSWALIQASKATSASCSMPQSFAI